MERLLKESIPVLRQLSLCNVMEAIVHCAPISRASIAKQTGLSKQTVSEVVKKLESDQWIQETGRTQGHVGRAAVTYEVIPNAACILSVDLGGTKVRVAIADLACNILAELTQETHVEGGLKVVEQIADMGRQAAKIHTIDFEKIKLAIVGVPGAPDKDTGRVLMAPNILNFDVIDVKQALIKELGLDVILENDVNLALLGEHWVGTGANINNLVYIGLGTGIGSGVMVEGNLVRGFRNMAGELGYLPIGADSFEPESTRVGALERAVGTIGIQNRYKQLSKKTSSVPEIFDAASDGDENAQQVLDEVARNLARAVTAICSITNPQKIIFGGSIGARTELIERVKKIMPTCYPFTIEMGGSDLGSLAAIVGGAAIGLNHLHTLLFSGGVPGAIINLPPVAHLNNVLQA